MTLFNRIFLIVILPLMAMWMIVTGDSKEMPLLLKDIYKDMKK